MMPSSPLHPKLRQLVGQRFRYLSEDWLLVEVLPDEDKVVLQRLGTRRTALQADQYGSPQRLSSEILSLPISSSEGYSEEMLLLLRGRQ